MAIDEIKTRSPRHVANENQLLNAFDRFQKKINLQYIPKQQFVHVHLLAKHIKLCYGVLMGINLGKMNNF